MGNDVLVSNYYTSRSSSFQDWLLTLVECSLSGGLRISSGLLGDTLESVEACSLFRILFTFDLMLPRYIPIAESSRERV